MSKFDLKDNVTVITGAAGGIGTELSREFLSAGAKVVLTSRDLDKLNALATELNSENTLVVEMDIIDPASVEAMVKKVTEHFGRIDTLINNAGGGVDGFTHLVWGQNTIRDILQLKPQTEEYVKPVVGTMLIFPNWLKHAVTPFYGEGERRSIAFNWNVHDTETEMRKYMSEREEKQFDEKKREKSENS